MGTPSVTALVPGTGTLFGVIEFCFEASTGLSAVQEDIKTIAAKQPIAINSFFIKNDLKIRK